MAENINTPVTVVVSTAGGTSSATASSASTPVSTTDSNTRTPEDIERHLRTTTPENAAANIGPGPRKRSLFQPMPVPVPTDTEVAPEQDEHAPIDSAGNSGPGVVPANATPQNQEGPAIDGAALEQLLQKLTTDDIYAKTVKAILQRTCGWRLGRITLALLFTSLLQMGLIILLWNGLLKGFDAPGVYARMPETDRLWVQARQMQRQLCWLHQHVQLKDPKYVTWDVKKHCALAWPRQTSGSNWCDWETYHFNMDQSTKEFMPNISEVEACLLRDWSVLPRTIVQERDPSDSDWQFYNMSYLNNSDACQKLRGITGLRAFAEGLFSPRGQDAPSELYKGGWKSSSGVFENSHALCIEADEALGYPDSAFDSTSFPNLLALLALTVYAHDEATRALSLAYVAATGVSLVPPFFRVESLSGVRLPVNSVPLQVPVAACVVLLLCPLLQLLMACAVLFTGGALFLSPDNQDSTLSIIFNAVTLGFVLDIDNKVGGILGLQQQYVPEVHQVERVADKGTNIRPLPGILYFAVLGFFIMLEPLLMVSAYAGAATSGDPTHHLSPDGAPAAADIWSDLATGTLSLYDWPQFMGALSFFVLYPVGLLIIVSVIFPKPLPSSSTCWHGVLLAAQFMLVLGAYLCDWGDMLLHANISPDAQYYFIRSSAFTYILMPCVFVVCWVLLFIAWPCGWHTRVYTLYKALTGGVCRVFATVRQFLGMIAQCRVPPICTEV